MRPVHEAQAAGEEEAAGKQQQQKEAANRKARNEKRYCMAIKKPHTDTH